MAPFRKLTCILLLCLLCATGAYAAETTVNRIAAVVNGEMITLHELRMHTMAELARNNMKPEDPRAGQLKLDVLDSLINDILMRQEAKRYSLKVSESEVEQELSFAIKRSGVPADKFEAGLKTQGMTMEMYKERVGNSILRRRIANFMVARKVFVTPEEISSYYEKNRDEFAGEKNVDFSIMMLPENSNPQKVYQQIKSGSMSFEDAARQFSTDRSAPDGGRLTGIPWDRLPPEMQKLLSSLENGKISQLLRTRGGFVVIRKDAINEPRPLSLQEATPRIEEILKAPLLDERFKEYIGVLRGKAVIDIRI